jgi:luciferase family oxidoreductase group 1
MIANSTKTNYFPKKSDRKDESKSLSTNNKLNESNSVKSLQLGVLDIGWITPGKTAVEVVQETLMSASLADSLGYSRYWLAEHHEPSFAWASPEIMLALIAQSTDRISVGTAGILLYFYSPLKIAEVFRLLEVLYPKRVDLGIAGGIAGDRETIQALAPGFDLEQAVKNDLYGQKVSQLIDYLTDNFRLGGDFALDATPKITEIPQMWLLGTGKKNMQKAALLGTAFCYSLYHACSQKDINIVREYRHEFQSSVMLHEPKCNLAVSVVCAETEAEARQQKNLVEKIDKTSTVNVAGTPEQCKEQLLEIQHQYQVSEIIMISSWHIFERRKFAYQILAEVLNLSTTNQY